MENKDKVKIISLSITDARKIVAAEITVDSSGITLISGGNKSGKSTIIDCLETLFVANSRTPKQFIRNGADKTTEEIKLKNVSSGNYYIIKKVVKEDGQDLLTIKEEDSQGNKIRSVDKPQKFLSGLINSLSFDPASFRTLTSEEKLKRMKELMGLNFVAQDQQLKVLREDLAGVNKSISLAEVKELPDKIETKDLRMLMAERDALVKANSDKEIKYAARVSAKTQEYLNAQSEVTALTASMQLINNTLGELPNKISAKEISINNLMNQLSAAKEELRLLNIEKDNLTKDKEEIEKEYIVKTETLKVLQESSRPENIKRLPEENPDSTEELDIEIKEIEEHNKKVYDYELKVSHYHAYIKHVNRKKELTAKIASIKKEKRDMISAAPQILEDLEVILDDDHKPDGVYFKGTHSDSWSRSEALSISAAICHKMSPSMNAIFIDDGEMFDANNLALLQKWAVENDIQIILTTVGAPDTALFGEYYYITEGEVINAKELSKINSGTEVAEDIFM